jgi:serine/threonine protein kinase
MVTKLGLIGQGAYGVVYKVQNIQNKEIMAVKRIKLTNNEDGLPSSAIREIALLKELEHPNIIKLYDVNHSQHCLALYFEYCDWDLCRFVEARGGRLCREEVVNFTRQLLLALQYIHGNHIIHRDVKPQNLLVNRRNQLKLADFGLARSTFIPFDSLSTEVITLWYRPPEIALGMRDYGVSIDMWSAGCVLVEMLTGNPLFPFQTNETLISAITELFGIKRMQAAFPTFEFFSEHIEERNRYQPVGLRSLLKDREEELIVLAERLLDPNPATRISAKEALAMPVFASSIES